MAMPISSPSTRASLGRYRPVLYIATGLAAAYAILLIHRHLYPSNAVHTGLRRRNAVRRPPSRRRGGASSASRDPNDISTSVQAIQRLQELESEDTPYGTFRVEVENGRTYQCPLMPLDFPSNEVLQRELDVAQDQAEIMHRMMEDAFLENFFAFEYPPSHVISQSNGEHQYLLQQLLDWGFTEASVVQAINRFNQDPNFGADLRRRRRNGEATSLAISGNTVLETRRDLTETAGDNQSVFSWRDGSDDTAPSREGQNLLNLLYHIAEDQARRDGYIHRGVTCNSCGVMPIQGIRYRCANCIDYDLCETCEAMQGHIKTHLFYKVRIPAPFLGNPRQSQPVWYPGKPMMLPRNLSRPLAKRLMKETNFENTELDALWDQFRCLANVEWPNDPNKFNMAIDRKTFDRCFVPNTSLRPPPPSLIYDRMFSFYDTNGDNLIGFEEFLKGLASFNNKSTHERLKRIFRGYDIDRDGYVERKDFLRIFRAYYTLSREVTRDLVAGMEDDFLEGGTRDVILGSQPISSAFPGSIPSGDPSRIGEGKQANLHGDMEIADNQGILRDDGEDACDRHVIIGDAAVRNTYGRSRPQFLRPSLPRPLSFYGNDGGNEDHDRNDASSEFSGDFEEWLPAEEVQPQDIVNALGAYVPYEEVTDHVDRARIGTCVAERFHVEDQEQVEDVRRAGIEERWRRRRFYIDEEDGATAPLGYHDEDEDVLEDADAMESHAPSPRSRSSSKVRFQDDVTDNEYETRSNPSTSSRSIPVGERWGGFEIPEAERDVGKEILYQVTQEGLNELLDMIFKPKEDLLMEAYRTRAERKRWAKEIENFAMAHSRRSAVDGKKPVSGSPVEDISEQLGDIPPGEKSLPQLLDEAGYSIVPESEGHGPIESDAPDATPEPEDGHHQEYPSDYSSDPMLPQNRPNGPEIEPFPLAPENMPFELDEEEIESVHGRISPPPDPTLPQFRPDSDDLPEALQINDITTSNTLANRSITNNNTYYVPIYESPSTSTSASVSGSNPPRQARQHPNSTLPLRLRFQQPHLHPHPHHRRPPSSHTSQIVNPSSSTTSSSSSSSHSATRPIPPPSPPVPPSPKTLARWHRLNQVEKEAKERGGTGAKLNFEEFAMRMQGERGNRLGFVGSWIDMISF
ncbi:hypothetical protein PRK78_005158 [Emydomyces testavorans]|uniref:EF hand domain-containing protein n=1 Tax=Emydomyces testavorans TaxID=2070801 RepID=A0AAF0DJ04_9EURO|nr:hypothetical protein PRK78_005158 [Emydomyces testavorans]